MDRCSRRTRQPGMVYLEMREDHSSSGHSVPLSRSRADGIADGRQRHAGAHSRSGRDAGTLTFEGTFRDGVGGGIYGFAGEPGVSGELEKRGVGRPTADQQDHLAAHDVGLALARRAEPQGYPKAILAT